MGLDVGTTKVCAVIGERSENGNLEITGVGHSVSTGLRKGVVVNIEATLRSVSQAIEAAEMRSGREVRACWTGIGGSHIEGIHSRGVVTVAGRNRDETREIGEDDINRVLEVARGVVIPLDRQILTVIPQSYIVDNQKGIRDPLDMIGMRLESEVHIITCSATSAGNLIKCVNRAGFMVNDLILQSLASGRAVLTEEERDMGVALIDFGGGTTDLLVYCEGAPYSTATVPAGGTQVTSDISILNHISFENAEKIKREAGCCWEGLLEEDSDVIVPGVGSRPPQAIPRSHILAVIKPRVEEIFKMVKERLDALALPRPLGGGVVLTGGGALLPGTAELAQEIFSLPVRTGFPLGVEGLSGEFASPVYAAAIGLVLEGGDRELRGAERGEARSRGDKGQADLFGKLKEWLAKEFF
ncbi:MAG: cell division protein FtsA [Treponema sp.]|nr:cell division protein FtsA [Treponema sp.]